MITLDTHIVIWIALKPNLLSSDSKKAISNANRSDGLIISDISLWEIAMLIHKNRIEIEADYQEFIDLILRTNKIHIKEITPEIAEFSTFKFPPGVNFDPADRLIAATSILHNAPLVTADKNLIQTKMIPTIW